MLYRAVCSGVKAELTCMLFSIFQQKMARLCLTSWSKIPGAETTGIWAHAREQEKERTIKATNNREVLLSKGRLYQQLSSTVECRYRLPIVSSKLSSLHWILIGWRPLTLKLKSKGFASDRYLRIDDFCLK